MSIQRRLYEQLAKLNQEKVIEDGPAHQNPLKTTFGGMKKAKNTPSMKGYHAKVKADQAARDKRLEQERLAKKGTNEEKKKKKNPVPEKNYDYDYAGRGTSKESVDLDEKLQFKLKTKFKPSTARGSGTKKERMTIYDVIIDGVRVGMLEKEVSQDFNYGDGGSYMTFKILQPGSRNKYAEKILVDDVEDPNDFFKQLKKNPRTAKRTIKALKAHGVELTGLDSKHESVDLEELKKSTLMSYIDMAKKSERSGRDTGFEGETPSERKAGVRQVKKRVKGIDGATRRLVARQYQPEDVEQVDELSSKTLLSYADKAQKDNTQRVTRMADKPDHMPVDKGEMKKLRKRQTGVVKAKNKTSMGEEVEQVDELKMPEKSKRGRATDPVIAAALKRGWKRADLTADGKLRRGDAEGAESHMTNARKRKIASRVESVDLDEKLQIKLKSKFKPSSGGSDVNKIFDVIIDGVRVGIMTKETSDDHNYGDGGSYMSFKILKPGSRNKYAEHINVNDVEDPNDFFKQLKKDPRTAKRTIKALKAHGVELTNINSKHESVDLDELSTDTLRRYVYTRRGQVQSDLNTGKHSPKTNKSAKGVVAALSRLDARKNKLEPELKR